MNIMAAFLPEEEHILILEKILNTSDFKLFEIKQKSLSEGEPSGLLGEHFKVEATVLQGSSSEQFTLHYFVKLKPKEGDILRELVDSTRAYEKESRFYSTLFDDLRKQYFEVHHCRNQKHNFWSCMCYLSKEDVIIVLEDLSASGFRTHLTGITFDYNHSAAVLRTLASFHAASLVYEVRQFATKALNLKELHPDILFEAFCVKEKNHLGYIYCNTALKGMLSLCKYLPNYGMNHKHHEHIQRSLADISNQVYELVKPSSKFRNVICHCDLSANNIMFRYGSTGEPEDACLIDFQLMRYCPPAHDIMLFLHLTTTRKFRQTHLKELLELYYITLSSELALYDLQVQTLLPWTELLASCEEYSITGLIFAAMYFQNNFMDSEKIKEIVSNRDDMKQILFQDKTNFIFSAFKNDLTFRERISDSVEELIESCILGKIDLS